jgi:hypothetical protein
MSDDTLEQVAIAAIDDHATQLRHQIAELEAAVARLTAERDAARVPLCIGRPLITIMAEQGAWCSSDGRAVVAADDLFGQNPYDEIAALRTRLEAAEGLRDEWGQRLDDAVADGKMLDAAVITLKDNLAEVNAEAYQRTVDLVEARRSLVGFRTRLKQAEELLREIVRIHYYDRDNHQEENDAINNARRWLTAQRAGKE